MSVYRQVHQGCLAAIRIGDPDKGRLIIPAEVVESIKLPAQSEPSRTYHRLAAAARFLGVSYGHLHREVQGGRFPGMRVRTVWLIPTAAIDVMVQAAIDRSGMVLASEFGQWTAAAPVPVPPEEQAPCHAVPRAGRVRPAVP